MPTCSELVGETEAEAGDLAAGGRSRVRGSEAVVASGLLSPAGPGLLRSDSDEASSFSDDGKTLVASVRSFSPETYN